MHALHHRSFTDEESGLPLPYRLFVPDAHDERSALGLLLFLHGAGQRGQDNQAQLENSALAFVESPAQARYPTVVVYPQCPTSAQWVDAPWDEGRYALATTPMSRPLAAAMKLVAGLAQEFPIDPDRVLVAGLSMGGYGTWDLLARRPQTFAGALPVCGGGDPTQAAAIHHVPIWAFHGDADPTVPVRGSRQMIEALRAAGGEPRYTELRGGGHDVWTQALGDPEVVAWLLSRRRGLRTV
jgi:predicted peptidase